MEQRLMKSRASLRRKQKMEIVFDHGKPVEDAFAMLRN